MSKQPIISAAEYQRLYGRNPAPRMRAESGKVKKGRPGASENVVVDSIEIGDGWCRITLAGVIRGLNSSKGLLRQHWTARAKEKERFSGRILALNAPAFPGKVRITLIRFCAQFMDWDNMSSTAKLPFDALKKCKVIIDDSPQYILEFIPKQIKCRRKDQRTCIFIEDINNVNNS